MIKQIEERNIKGGGILLVCGVSKGWVEK